MARKINVRKILDELIKRASHNSIASLWHISKHSVSDVAAKGLELGILPEGPVPDMDDDSLYKLFFPEKITAEDYVWSMERVLSPDMKRWTLRRSTKSSIAQESHSSCCGRSTRSNASAMARMR